MPSKTTDKKAAKPSLRYLRDKDRELVKGVFKFHEVDGGSMSFWLKLYKEDPLERYDLIDGGIYTLPLGVAKHLNKNCWYPKRAHVQDEHGNVTEKVATKERRCSFQSLEFMDIEELSEFDGPVIKEVETQSVIR